eukprot:CAMPEP_0202370056 /NCGR_PEP_ID=MMETSP1127-20130417/1758_1 /ASSEMBLY_ACC=CAM_ASM_000462 /TAXON_ID=3047 /ORGANISM="Dunaliella tertiolecta, Strain CCMP1320" /LENGTH=225 /DNA_ID=CAMNT_0048965899 /DNA_START=372 /DNA_END=1050 /DNA_ORIENTATION=+
MGATQGLTPLLRALMAGLSEEAVERDACCDGWEREAGLVPVVVAAAAVAVSAAAVAAAVAVSAAAVAAAVAVSADAVDIADAVLAAGAAGAAVAVSADAVGVAAAAAAASTAAAPAFLTPGAPQLLTLMGIQSLELRVLLHLIGRHLQHHAHPEQHLLLLLGQLGLGQQLRLAPEPPCQNFPTRLGAVAVAWGHIGVAMYCFEAPQLMVHVHPLSLNVTNGPLKA